MVDWAVPIGSAPAKGIGQRCIQSALRLDTLEIASGPKATRRFSALLLTDWMEHADLQAIAGDSADLAERDAGRASVPCIGHGTVSCGILVHTRASPPSAKTLDHTRYDPSVGGSTPVFPCHGKLAEQHPVGRSHSDPRYRNPRAMCRSG